MIDRTLHDILGASIGMEFLIERIEKEPDWLQAGSQSIWQSNAYSLEHWRKELRDPEYLSDRLLRIVTNELRRDLRTRKLISRAIYARNFNPCFWNEKTADFLAVANQVWNEQRPLDSCWHR
jgi:hypothetical protein